MNEQICLKCILSETACHVDAACAFTRPKTVKLVQIGRKYDKRTLEHKRHQQTVNRLVAIAAAQSVDLEKPIEYSPSYRAWVRSVLMS